MPAHAHNRDHPKNPDQGKPCIRHHVVEIWNTEKRASVSEAMVVEVLRDWVHKQKTGQTNQQQPEQDRYALPE
jgi:hypothetical protein